MEKPLSFQEVIMRLEQFWSVQGCLIWQPYNVQVGAGTMNPATFVRVLGPENWRVAYVEPSIRPRDGRYGQNPNRTQQFYQYQVILKPDPGNPLEIYLESLEALGIDPRQHDIRFVEDNWQAADLGAWGLGWEVWCDGQEITQFTYFQQAGGFALDPVSVEITYGLDRITTYLQGVDHFADIAWGAGLTYGDVLLHSEVEHCVYNFELADVERMRELYGLYEAEARSCLERGLVIPAHDYVLKCSHTFNVLDARGAVGVTERAYFFARMRELSRQVAEAYLDQREEMGFPWKRLSALTPQAPGQEVETGDDATTAQHCDAVLEIGTEELPAQDVTTAIEQLRQLVPTMLAGARLSCDGIWVSGTPRRLAVVILGLATRQAEEEHAVKGPPARVAYDAQGNPTRAAEGFARAQGVPVDSLQMREMDGGQYMTAIKVEAGRPAVDVLAQEFPDLIAAIRFPMTMRWNESNVAFSRPIRWLVALHGSRVIPFRYAGVASGRVTRGLRPDGSPEMELGCASDYQPLMEAQGIVVDGEERRSRIGQQAAALAADVGGIIPEDPQLLDEVANLVEQPTALRGEFSSEYLALPPAVLVTAMKKHQRYFPVVRRRKDSTGEQLEKGVVLLQAMDLLPYFVVIRNGDTSNLDGVRHGYEEVLRARFADAAFFFEADTRQPLEAFLPRLDTLTFQEQLGSVLDKTRRLERIVPDFADQLGLSDRDGETALRAAHLCKADLATQMVVEFTSLQGTIGREYALRSGESEAVAQAIFEHYLPRFAGDALPQGNAGLTLSVADRLDSLLGLFGAGLAPTGSSDPYGLRRAAIGLIQLLVERGLRFDLRKGLALTAEQLPIEADSSVQSEVLAFIGGRLEGWLREQGHRHDLVAAVLAEREHDPFLAVRTVEAFSLWVEREDWMDILNSYARCVRIVRGLDELLPLTPEHFVEPATEHLYQVHQDVAAVITSESSIDELLEGLRSMIPAITRFFDEVLVMTEDMTLRAARLALLQRIAVLPSGIVDLSQVMGF